MSPLQVKAAAFLPVGFCLPTCLATSVSISIALLCLSCVLQFAECAAFSGEVTAGCRLICTTSCDFGCQAIGRPCAAHGETLVKFGQRREDNNARLPSFS